VGWGVGVRRRRVQPGVRGVEQLRQGQPGAQVRWRAEVSPRVGARRRPAAWVRARSEVLPPVVARRRLGQPGAQVRWRAEVSPRSGQPGAQVRWRAEVLPRVVARSGVSRARVGVQPRCGAVGASSAEGRDSAAGWGVWVGLRRRRGQPGVRGVVGAGAGRIRGVGWWVGPMAK
jgi:hypothetical protein